MDPMFVFGFGFSFWCFNMASLVSFPGSFSRPAGEAIGWGMVDDQGTARLVPI